MKKIVASVGLVALGASGINAVHAQDISTAPAKSWNISASLRGFYDDNVNSTPTLKESSFGFEIRPGFSLNWGNDQTTLKLGYTYGLKWYENGPWNAEDSETADYSQNHNFEATLQHVFNERYRISLGEVFSLGQEPDMLRGADGVSGIPQYLSGDNYRNYAKAVFNAQLTSLLSAEVGYANEYYNYSDSVYAALMNRMGHTIHLEGQYQITPETLGLVGGRFGMTGFTGDEQIGGTILNPIVSEDRNSRYYMGYLGVQHVFRPDLSGSIRGGVRSTDYYNDPTADNQISPYAQGSLRYTYTLESYAELGVNYDLSSTDLLTVDTGGGYTLDAETLLVYGTIHQRLAPKFFVTVTGTIQNSTFNGGTSDGDTELYYSLGLDLSYRFNTHFAANAGYNFDKVNSDGAAGRDYTRNQVYVGVTATY